jgi:hypothetical protein
MAELRTSLNQELTALSECFKKAELNYGKIPNQPSQINAQKQLHKLLKLIFASKEFVTKLTLDERTEFYNDYTNGIANVLLTGDCLSFFEEMQEWYEYLEELEDYDEFRNDIKTRENVTFDDIKKYLPICIIGT